MAREKERLEDVIKAAKGFLASSAIFSQRDELKVAEEYLCDIARSTGEAPYVITAAMVYARTLVKVLLRAAEVPEEEIDEVCKLQFTRKEAS
jgi:hypothetical protein